MFLISIIESLELKSAFVIISGGDLKISFDTENTPKNSSTGKANLKYLSFIINRFLKSLFHTGWLVLFEPYKLLFNY